MIQHCAILIGGASQRMGRAKHALPWRGTTLLAYLIGEAEAAGLTVSLVGSAGADQLIKLVSCLRAIATFKIIALMIKIPLTVVISLVMDLWLA